MVYPLLPRSLLQLVKQLRRELNAQKRSSAVLHDHLEELKKKTAAAEEVLERTASLFDELQKQESHLMLQKFGEIPTARFPLKERNYV